MIGERSKARFSLPAAGYTARQHKRRAGVDSRRV
jgi:hypothetical protein